MKKPLLVIFDGNALIHRAFHALPPFTVRKTGEAADESTVTPATDVVGALGLTIFSPAYSNAPGAAITGRDTRR